MTGPVSDGVGLDGLFLTGYNTRGVVRVVGEVPNGTVTIQRRSQGTPTYTLRNGSNVVITTEGFIREDSEAPIGVPLTYTATSTPTNRIIQRNLVNTPNFSRGQLGWTPGTGRTFTVSGGYGHVTSNTGGSGIAGQVIAEVGLGTLKPSTTYLVYGKVSFQTPDVATWLDVRNLGTWQAVKTARANWSAVLNTQALVGSDVFAQLQVGLSSAGAPLGSVVQALNVQMDRAGTWMSIAVYLTTPSSVPAGTKLRLQHGSTLREKSISWDLDEFSMQESAIVSEPYKLMWFSGDSVKPADPANYLTGTDKWTAVTSDSAMSWEGTVGNSVSRFTGPSKISTSSVITLEPPDIAAVCGPLLLSDPVNSGIGLWFGLGDIGDLDYDDNLNLMKVLNRPDYIAASTARNVANGSLVLFTKTLEERTQAIQLFASGRVLYLRNSDAAYPENNWYIAVGKVRESRTLPDARRPERTWSFPYTRVERPSGLIENSSGVTWAQIKSAGLTWQQIRDDRDDWLDVLAVTP